MKELLAAYIEQSRLMAEIVRSVALKTEASPLADVVKRQQDTIDRMQATLDRIVTAQYDKPIERHVIHTKPDQMPLWSMNDQGEVRPDEDEIARGLSSIAVSSDAEFLSAVGSK